MNSTPLQTTNDTGSCPESSRVSPQDEEEIMRRPDDVSSAVLLEQENKRLRSQVDDLKLQLSRLQQRPNSPTLSPPSRKSSVGSWKWLNGFQLAPQEEEEERVEDTGLYDDSLSGDRDVMEMPPSPLGLHHRRGPSPPNTPHFEQLPLTSQPESPEPFSSFKSKSSDIERPTDDGDDSDLSDTILLTDSNNNGSFRAVLKDRAGWLVGLLVLQSCSSFIIKNNQEMLSEHIVIVRFLTMLVGAGGNAGNQASVRVIRGLAIGTVNSETVRSYLEDELRMGICLSAILGLAGCIRAAVFLTPVAETVAITSSLIIIVAISILIGALLPLGMKYVNIDPAHSSTTIQVLMDILGVTITVYVSAAVLDGPFGILLGAAPHA